MYPQGRMSHHFREMQEGDYLAVKGPKVHKFSPYICLNNPLASCYLSSFYYTLAGTWLVSWTVINW